MVISKNAVSVSNKCWPDLSVDLVWRPCDCVLVLAAHTNRILGALCWSKLLLPRPVFAPTFITHKLATGGGVGGPPKKEEKLLNTNKWTKRKLPDDACC